MGRLKRFTIYDAMEERGDFRSNSANSDSMDKSGNQLYKGPVEFPRLVYAAEEEVITSGTFETIKGRGDIMVGELKATKFLQVNDANELAQALESGWYDHPAKALAAIIATNKAAGIDDRRKVPTITAQETLDAAERKIRELEAELAKNKALMEVSGAGENRGPKGKTSTSVAA
jgi:hypothetical protein